MIGLTTPFFHNTLIAIATILLTAYIADRLLQRLVRVPKKLNTKRTRTYISIVRSSITVVVFGAAIYYIFIILGIDVTPLLASAGIAGIALGFGARSLIEDLISGIFLLTQDTIRIGDYVKAAGAEGVVEQISFKTISIRDRDGGVHIIPNGQVKTVINLSRGRARVTIDFPVKADQPIDRVIKALETALKNLKKDKSLGKKIIDADVRGIEDIQPPSRLFVRTVIITQPASRWQIARRLRFLVKKEFEKENLQFA